MQAPELSPHGQPLLEGFADAFSSWGFQRFSKWITGLARNPTGSRR
jgi:hypothetical protein